MPTSFTIALLLTVAAAQPPAPSPQSPSPSPLITRSGFPRAGFFRTSEWSAANPKTGLSYEAWEAEHAVLDGIYGKVLGEESVSTEEKSSAGLTKLDFFNRYKQRFPEKLVLLHFNGNARMPIFHPGAVFAGHWLYYRPVRINSAVPAAGGTTTIEVSSVLPFSLAEGKFAQNGTDVCLVPVRGGAVDWSHAEQVTVTAINEARSAITVHRGQYGTAPLNLAAGAALAFPHATEGPFGAKGRNPPLLWKYNFSRDAPRNAQGRSLADTLSDELAGLFAAEGKLHLFDGLEFDATNDHQRPDGPAVRKRLDFDFHADGRGDDGTGQGLFRYGLGRRRFFEELRRKMGPQKIIMADLGQHGFGLLNGVESEGFPRSQCYDFVLWSERMNHLDYWAQHSASPAFSLITGKFIAEKGKDSGASGFVPLSTIRLQIAASTLCGAAYFPFYKADPDSKSVFIADELVMGRLGRTGWLGMPSGPAVYLAEGLPDALAGNWKGKLSSSNGTIQRQEQTAVITAPARQDVAFTLSAAPYKNHALFATITFRAEPRQGAPAEYSRLLSVVCGQEVKTWRTQELALDADIGPKPFTARFYFSKNRYETKPPGDPCDLKFTVEGPEAVYVDRLEIRNAPDAAYREFANGLVLANPSDRLFTYDLESLFPGKSFTRLLATPGQDKVVNDGLPAGKSVTVPARDALFLKTGLGTGDSGLGAVSLASQPPALIPQPLVPSPQSPVPLHYPSTHSAGTPTAPCPLSPLPPMGWNSYDSYGVYLHEKAAYANLQAMAEKLKPYGYEYFVIDNGWFGEYALRPGTIFPAEKQAHDIHIDQFGHFLPSHVYFPGGLKPIAERCHALGLKFGVHLMRGIPRKAYDLNLPIQGTPYTARDVADTDPKENCKWCSYCYGVNMSKPGAQQWYDGLIQHVVDLGVGFIKYDDIVPHPREVEAVAKAIRKTGKPVVLSLSPGGEVDPRAIDFFKMANMLRVTKDIWDQQRDIDVCFTAWRKWQGREGPGFWIDMDMIPFGQLQLMSPPRVADSTRIPTPTRSASEAPTPTRGASEARTRSADVALSGRGTNRWCQLTKAQMTTFITLRALAASPLMVGGDLPTLDEFSLTLLTNRDMIACDQNGIAGHLILQKDGIEVWRTPFKANPGTGWIGIFNRTPEKKEFELSAGELELSASSLPRLWNIWADRAFDPARKTSIEPQGVVFLGTRD